MTPKEETMTTETERTEAAAPVAKLPTAAQSPRARADIGGEPTTDEASGA